MGLRSPRRQHAGGAYAVLAMLALGGCAIEIDGMDEAMLPLMVGSRYYEAELPSVPIGREGTHTFIAGPLCCDHTTFVLRNSTGAPARPGLCVAVRILDHRGAVLAAGDGALGLEWRELPGSADANAPIVVPMLSDDPWRRIELMAGPRVMEAALAAREADPAMPGFVWTDYAMVGLCDFKVPLGETILVEVHITGAMVESEARLTPTFLSVLPAVSLPDRAENTPFISTFSPAHPPPSPRPSAASPS